MSAPEYSKGQESHDYIEELREYIAKIEKELDDAKDLWTALDKQYLQAIEEIQAMRPHYETGILVNRLSELAWRHKDFPERYEYADLRVYPPHPDGTPEKWYVCRYGSNLEGYKTAFEALKVEINNPKQRHGK